MPIGVLFEFRGATSRAKYEKSVKLILKGRRKRLADWPVKGVLAHIAGPMPGGWRVIDVWQSRAAFNQFRRPGGQAKAARGGAAMSHGHEQPWP